MLRCLVCICVLVAPTLAASTRLQSKKIVDLATSSASEEKKMIWKHFTSHPTGYPTSYPTSYPTTRYPTSYPTTSYPTSSPTGSYVNPNEPDELPDFEDAGGSPGPQVEEVGT